MRNVLQQLGNPFYLSILGSRMLFNLKEAGEMGVNEGTNYRVPTMSNIEFEEGAGYEGSFRHLINLHIGINS